MPISDYLWRLRARVGNELVLMPAVTGVIFDGDGRILLAKHSNAGEWGTPGGSLDPDESPADAVVRELYEETRLEVEPVRLLGVYGGPEFQVSAECAPERMAFAPAWGRRCALRLRLF